jgi:hypothetical protein
MEWTLVIFAGLSGRRNRNTYISNHQNQLIRNIRSSGLAIKLEPLIKQTPDGSSTFITCIVVLGMAFAPLSSSIMSIFFVSKMIFPQIFLIEAIDEDSMVTLRPINSWLCILLFVIMSIRLSFPFVMSLSLQYPA